MSGEEECIQVAFCAGSELLRTASWRSSVYSLAPEDPGPPARKQQEGRPGKKGKGGKRGPPKRCDTLNPTTANGAAHLPGGHNQLCQVAISHNRPSKLYPHRAYPKRITIRAKGIIKALCTTHRCACTVHKKVTARDRDASKRKAGPPWRGGYRRARLEELVTRRNSPTTLAYAANGRFLRRGDVL